VKRSSHIWLLGLSGSGKSTVGPLVAQKLGLPFADTDAEIIQSAQRPISHIFAQGGETEFRKWESQIVAQLAQKPPTVISCGAGVILSPENRLILSKTGSRIYLKAELSILIERLSKHTDRPLLRADQLEPNLLAQLSDRKKWYEESEITIPIESATPEQICQRILLSLASS
jgi:shikimate kinase